MLICVIEEITDDFTVDILNAYRLICMAAVASSSGDSIWTTRVVVFERFQGASAGRRNLYRPVRDTGFFTHHGGHLRQATQEVVAGRQAASGRRF